MPRHTFFGYRYIAISATEDVTFQSIESVPVSSITAESETGTLTTGNDDVNRLIQNTLWGMRSNYLSVPTDCPQRNERLGWTADTQVFSETGTFFANTYPFMLKWMGDMRDTQSPKGGFPGVAPWGQYGSSEHDMMRVGWADAGVIVPWTLWKQMGDTRIIDENWEAMLRYINHVADTRYDHTALSAENSNFQWADWLSYEPLESCGGGAFGPKGPLPDAIIYWNYLCASYWIIDAEMMRDMAAATGRDAATFEKMVADAKAYVKGKFLKADGTFKTPIFNTMQTPALFALRNGLVDGKAREQMIARLRQNFADHGDCLQTGFLRHKHSDAHAYCLRTQRRGLHPAPAAQEPQLALFGRQRRHHRLGTLEQLHDREGNGSARYEQFQPLCLRLRLPMAMGERCGNRCRCQEAWLQAHHHGSSARSSPRFHQGKLPFGCRPHRKRMAL